MIKPKTISQDRDICKIVKDFLKNYPFLEYKSGGHHGKVFSNNTHDFVVIPTTPSDYRAVDNLKAGLRRLVNNGTGVMAERGVRMQAA